MIKDTLDNSDNFNRFISSERVEFHSNGAILKGKVFLPFNLETSKGFVIFVPGLGYCIKSYDLDGETFAMNGYITLMYDLRGHLNSTGEFKISYAIKDTLQAIDFLSGKYDIKNKDRVGILAHSTGSLIALLASIQDKRIKYGSIVSIVTSMQQAFYHWFESGHIQKVRDYYTHNGYIEPGVEKFLSHKGALALFKKGMPSEEELSFPGSYGLLKVKRTYDFFYEIANSPDIFDHIKEIKIPLILFRGLTDEIIPVEKTEELYEALIASDKKIVRTNAFDHFLNGIWPEVQTETLKFFNKQNKILK